MRSCEDPLSNQCVRFLNAYHDASTSPSPGIPKHLASFMQAALHGGACNRNRIVSERWVRSATAADAATDPAGLYQYFRWIDTERPERFYALGNLGQYVYVAPDADAVIVRSGSDWGIDNDAWSAMSRNVADRLAGT